MRTGPNGRVHYADKPAARGGLLVFQRVQLADHRMIGRHRCQMRNAHDDILPATGPDRMPAIFTRRMWCAKWLAMMMQLPFHVAAILSRNLSRTPARKCYFRPERIRLERNEVPCRSPAAVVPLRPETLRPCLSACLPSGGKIDRCTPPVNAMLATWPMFAINLQQTYGS